MLVVSSGCVASGPLVVDFRKSVFEPMGGSGEAGVAEVEGGKAVRLPCDFAGTKIDRASWDVGVKLDLTMCRGVQFEFYCADPTPVSHFSMYFQSGGGWYSVGFDAAAVGEWNTVEIDKSAARTEGTPGGWGKIDTIRISAWRGGNSDTEFFIRGLSLFGAGARIASCRQRP